MARPRKTGLEYFPLDVTAGIDDEIELLEAKFGIEGFAIYIKLLQKIYKKGYYIVWGEEEQLMFKKRTNIEQDKVNEIIAECIKRRLFSRRLFEEFNVLTSHGIQKVFLQAVDRRKEVDIEKQLWLLSTKEVSNLNVKVQINFIDTFRNEIIVEEQEESNNDQLLDENFKKVLDFYESNIGLSSGTVKEEISDYLSSNIEADLIIEGMRIACLKNVRNLCYVKKILNNWVNEGIYTLKSYKAIKVEKEANKRKSEQPRYTEDDLPC